MFAIVGAEYVMRWLPRGTHDWKKFLKPSELAAALRRADMSVMGPAGRDLQPDPGQLVPGSEGSCHQLSADCWRKPNPISLRGFSADF